MIGEIIEIAWTVSPSDYPNLYFTFALSYVIDEIKELTVTSEFLLVCDKDWIVSTSWMQTRWYNYLKEQKHKTRKENGARWYHSRHQNDSLIHVFSHMCITHSCNLFEGIGLSRILKSPQFWVEDRWKIYVSLMLHCVCVRARICVGGWTSVIDANTDFLPHTPSHCSYA